MLFFYANQLANAMTIVNRSHKFIYVHIPKTAGTSIKEFFGTFESPGDIYIREAPDSEELLRQSGLVLNKHSMSKEISSALGEKTFQEFYKFSVVRNPFARANSMFKFLKYNFRDWKKAALMDNYMSIAEFLTSDFFWRPGPGRIFEPQSHWLLDGQGNICMDFVGRVESLGADLVSVCEKCGLDNQNKQLLRRNVSDGISGATEFKSQELIDIVHARYAIDFDTFGYSRDPGDARASIIDEGR